MADVEASSARITGWGTALPEKIVTNVDLETTLDTSDEWITERTGIRERRVGGTTTGLGIEAGRARSEEHTSELQSLMRISYAVFCLKKKTTQLRNNKQYASTI